MSRSLARPPAVAGLLACVLALAAAPVRAEPPPAARSPAPAHAPKTVIVVRHAEAEPESVGPERPLSARGRRRALDLARLLGEARPQLILSTPYPRTRLTAEAVARRAGTPVTVIKETERILAAVAAAPWGSTVLVVGHSNTVPQIVAALAGQPSPDEPTPHDRLYVLSLGRDGAVSTLRLRYGEPDEAPPPR